MKMNEIAWQTLIKQYPGLHESVAKAYYAYHASSFDSHRTHSFCGMARTTRCVWCNRSREEVRWGNQPPHCQSRPPMPDIENIISTEESAYLELRKKAPIKIPKLIAKYGLNGSTLAMLQHTHGFDIDIIEEVLGKLPANLLMEYEKCMELHRKSGKK